MPTTPERRSRALVVMRIVSSLEFLSLVVILTNRFTIHSPAVTSSGGPIHGLLYVSTIVMALLLPFPRSAKWLAAVPGIGGLLALRRAGRVAAARAVAVPTTPPQEIELDERAHAAVVVDGAVVELARSSVVGPLAFAVPKGGITGVIGPNGAGKTTALRMMCGLIAPQRGAITVLPDDEPAGEEGRPAQPIGVLIDSPGFVPGLSARKNLLSLTRLAGWSPLLVDRALERVGLSAAADQRVGTFSLGMKQRLGLAAALLGEPRIVILDEPTNGLDPRGTLELRSFLRSLTDEGITVLIASHALDEIEELCDHLVAMDRGRIVFTGEPERLLDTLPSTLRCGVGDPADLRDLVGALEHGGHSPRVLDDVTVLVSGGGALGARLNQLAQDGGVTLSEITPRRPTLQEAFLALTDPDRPDRAADPRGSVEPVGAAR